MIVRKVLVAASISTVILVGGGYGSTAHAATALGTEGNVYLVNPYANPAEGLYGYSIAVGNFDGDGIDDMVLSQLGFSERFRVMHGKSYAIGGPYPFARFTSETVATMSYRNVIAAGDFNGDDIDEVAVGDPFSDSNPEGGGTVYIYRRTAPDVWALQTTIRQGLSGFNGVDISGDRFGSALASGDFDGDGFDDLAIGIPRKDQSGSPIVFGAGAVQVVYGSASGLSGARDQVFTSANDGLGYTSHGSDEYGAALAAGDIDNDGDDDLAIGVPRHACPNVNQRAGGVAVLKGSTSVGLSTLGAQSFLPGQSGVQGDCASEGRFGDALSIGKVNGQAYNGLAIGAPYVGVGGIENSGAVHILTGSASGANPNGSQFITVADLPGGVAFPNMHFGEQVNIGRLRTSTQSIAISASKETVNGLELAGGVWILYSGNGSALISRSIVEHWTGSANLGIGPPAAGDEFGCSTAIGDFNGDGRNDIAIGAFAHDSWGDSNTGGGQVLYQSQFIFSDGFDGH